MTEGDIKKGQMFYCHECNGFVEIEDYDVDMDMCNECAAMIRYKISESECEEYANT